MMLGVLSTMQNQKRVRGGRRNGFNHAVTSYSKWDKKQQGVPVNLILTRFLRGDEVRAFRKVHHLSAAALAQRLIKNPKTGATYSRPYVKRVESGGLRASPRFVKAFDELRATIADAPFEETRTVTAIVHHAIPDDVFEVEILAAFVKCAGCEKWFVPLTVNQKTHVNAACQRAARRKAKTKKRSAAWRHKTK